MCCQRQPDIMAEIALNRIAYTYYLQNQGDKSVFDSFVTNHLVFWQQLIGNIYFVIFRHIDQRYVNQDYILFHPRCIHHVP